VVDGACLHYLFKLVHGAKPSEIHGLVLQDEAAWLRVLTESETAHLSNTRPN
jgi:hypothetical protein